MCTYYFRRYRRVEIRAAGFLGKLVDQLAQTLQRAHRRGLGGGFRQQRLQQAEQALAPLRRAQCFGQGLLVACENTQQADQRIERGQAATFQLRPRCDTADVLIAAAGVAEQQPVQRELPGVGVIGRRLMLLAVAGIQAPARTRGLQPGVQAFEGGRIQAGGRCQRRAGQQVEDFIEAKARYRQAQQLHEYLGQRLALQRAGIGQRPGNMCVVAATAAEHRFQVGHVGIDIRRQHRDFTRLQRRVEARVFQQRAQLVMQHLHLAQAGVAGVDLDAGVVQAQRFPQGGRGQRAAMEQVRLQPVQQAVAETSLVQARHRHAFRVHIGGDFTAGVDHFVVAQHRHEVAAGLAPGLQQGVFAGLDAERLGQAAAQLFLQRLQIAPVRAGRRRHIEMQRADPRLGGDHPQHVRRDIERGKSEQPLRQALRQGLVRAFEAGQVVVDAARAVVLATGDVTPQDGLRVVRLGPVLPAQQPVAAPGLVFLEYPAQLGRQRPRAQRVIAIQVGAQPGHRRFLHQRAVGQRPIQPPMQAAGAQVIALAGHVGLQRLGDELARGQELQVGRHAIFGGQRRLQPAPHRHLRDQHDIGGQQGLAGRRLTQRVGQ